VGEPARCRIARPGLSAKAVPGVQDVVDVVHPFGISTRIARLTPLAVIKG
jgi:RNA-splicing ligase RtcB